MTTLANLNNGCSWRDTTDTWASSITWAGFANEQTLTNAVTSPVTLASLSNFSSWRETTDTWESSSTWASYSDDMSLSNAVTASPTIASLSSGINWRDVPHTWGTFPGVWSAETYPWLLTTVWQDPASIPSPYAWEDYADVTPVTNV